MLRSAQRSVEPCPAKTCPECRTIWLASRHGCKPLHSGYTAFMTSDPIIVAVNAALDAWLADAAKLFDDEGTRKRLFFESINRRRQAWTKPAVCMYPGCSAATIRRSHALQRNHALALIAEDGHVCTPEIDAEGRIYIKRIGIGHASTFPGFCEVHEDLFREFEVTGEITTVRHGVLQAFRTVCREIARRRFIVEQLEIEQRAHIDRRTSYLENAVFEATGQRGIDLGRLSGDPSEILIENGIKNIRSTILYLEKLYDELALAIRTGGGKGEASILHVPFRLPVALSGIVLIDYRKRSQRIRVAPCAIGVVPQAEGSIIFVATLNNHRQFMNGWMKRLQIALPMLDLVEGWMTHGSDHWFLTPSVWDGLANDRKDRILAELQSLEGVPSADPAEPILDDLRRGFVEALRAQVAAGDESDALASSLSLHEAKLGLPSDALY